MNHIVLCLVRKMASIEKRGNNSYRITVSCGFSNGGKRIKKSMLFTPSRDAKTKKQIKEEVKRAATEFESLVLLGKYFEGNRMKLHDFVDKWERDYAKYNISPSVMEGYKRMIEKDIYPYIGNMPIGKITPMHVQDIYSDMINRGLKANSVKKVHAVLSGIYTRAVKWGVIDSNANPMKRVDLPKKDKDFRIHCFTIEQSRIFLKALSKVYPVKKKAHKRVLKSTGQEYSVPEYTELHQVSLQFKCLFTLLLFSGIRRGECIALTWRDVDFKNSEVSIEKTAVKLSGKQILKEPKTVSGYRKITIPRFLIKMLKAWKKEQMSLSIRSGNTWQGKIGKDFDDNFIFIQDNGQQMHLSTPTHKFREIIDLHNANCKEGEELPRIRLHDLRHTSATLLISEGVDVRTVAGRLGHSSPSLTLNVYAEALQSADKDALKKLENVLAIK